MIKVDDFYQYKVVKKKVKQLGVSKEVFFGISFESVKGELYFKSIYLSEGGLLKRFNTNLKLLDEENPGNSEWNRNNSCGELVACYKNKNNAHHVIEKTTIGGDLLNLYYNVDDHSVADYCRSIIPETDKRFLEEFINLKADQKYFIVKTNGNFGYAIASKDYYPNKIIKERT